MRTCVIVAAVLVAAVLCAAHAHAADDCPRPKRLTAEHDSDEIRINWRKNDAPDTACWKVVVRAAGTKNWKTLHKCVGKGKITKPRSFVEALYSKKGGFPDGKSFADTTFAVKVKSVVGGACKSSWKKATSAAGGEVLEVCACACV